MKMFATRNAAFFVAATLSCLVVASESSSCSDGYNLNYTLPMFEQCKVKMINGSEVQLIPKLIPRKFGAKNCYGRVHDKIPPGYRVCRIPDCLKDPCKKGWCEEEMTNYSCHCPPEFTGMHCEFMIPTTRAQEETTVLDSNISASSTQRAPSASSAQRASADSHTQGASTTSPTQGASTTSPTQGASTTSSTQGASTTSPTQGASTTSSTQGASSTQPTQRASTTSPTQGASTTSSTQGASSTPPTHRASTTSPTQGVSTAPLTHRASTTNSPTQGTVPSCPTSSTTSFHIPALYVGGENFEIFCLEATQASAKRCCQSQNGQLITILNKVHINLLYTELVNCGYNRGSPPEMWLGCEADGDTWTCGNSSYPNSNRLARDTGFNQVRGDGNAKNCLMVKKNHMAELELHRRTCDNHKAQVVCKLLPNM